MTSSTYSIDRVAETLMERLEGMRRSYIDDEQELEKVAMEVVEEVVESYNAEHSALLGESDQQHHLERELTETFFPRWLRGAVQQNRKEAALPPCRRRLFAS